MTTQEIINQCRTRDGAWNVFVCTNTETIGQYADCDSISVPDLRHACREGGYTLSRVSPKSDYTPEANFRDWHGGRFDQFYRRCGLCAVTDKAPPAIVEAAYEFSETIIKACGGYV